MPQIWPEQCGSKKPSGRTLPKIQKLTMSPITSEIKDSLNGLPKDIREECIMTIKNKRNNQFHNNNQVNYSGNSNNNHGSNNNGQTNKGQGKKKKRSSANYETITCWFCNKKGHTQIDFREGLKRTNH